MEKRMQKRSVIKVLLLAAIALIMGLGVLFVGLNKAERVSGAEEDLPFSTIYLGSGGVNEPENNIYYYDDFERGWEEVVKRGVTANAMGSYVRAVLLTNWVADRTNGFGTNPFCFNSGRLYSPANTSIELDLNGKKLDRNLTSAVENGHVIYVAGDFTVNDRSKAKTGVVTGGYNPPKTDEINVFGGGVYVVGTFNLKGGTITGNKTKTIVVEKSETEKTESKVFGAGVFVQGGTFNMYGGTISGHTITTVQSNFGGAVCLYGSGTFNMYGGVIENNTSTYGGGVAIYDTSKGDTTAKINIKGGIIRNNHATPGTTGVKNYGGGAVVIYGKGTLNIEGGELYGNTSNWFGGAVFCLGSAVGTTTINVSGDAKIHDNLAYSLTEDTFGGGIAIRRASKTAGIFIDLNVIGGSIYNNKALSPASKVPSGGGIYNYGATFTMTNGSIYNNAAINFKPNEDDVNDVNFDDVDILGNTYGGGVFVYKPAESLGWNDARGGFIMKGGSLEANKGNSGGGLYVQGDVELRGGSITKNFGRYGGGLYLTKDARISLSGKAVVSDNWSWKDVEKPEAERAASNLEVAASDDRILQIGHFEPGANVHVFMHEDIMDNGTQFTQGYGTNNRKFVSFDNSEKPDNEEHPNNGVWVYANPYNYFTSDVGYAIVTEDNQIIIKDYLSQQHIMVLANGELGVARKAITFKVEFSDGSSKTYTYGDGVTAATQYNYMEWTYGQSVYPVKITAVGVEGDQEKTFETMIERSPGVAPEAGVYPLLAKPGVGDTKAAFYVVIKASPLDTSAVEIELPEETFNFTGEANEFSTITVKINGTEITLEKGKDYEISYVNNVNAGTATLVITFKGNYSGTAYATFEIGASTDTDTTLSVEWQVNLGEGWVPFTEEMYGTTFTYIYKTSQADKIRAALTATGGVLKQAVYAKGVMVTDGEDEEYKQNTSMSLEFTINLPPIAADFMDAHSYSIKILGEGNYQFAEDATKSISGVKILPMQLSLNASNFENDSADANANNKRWTLIIHNDKPAYGTLLDTATYIDPSAPTNKYGEHVTTGSGREFYARFRNTMLSIMLNDNYVLANGYTVGQIRELADSITYSEGSTGEQGQVSKVVTKVTITFGGNYTVSGGNTITLEKIWYIVTMTNDLLMADGSTISSTQLAGWTFGSTELQGYAFRPEHGNVIIYTYYNSLGVQLKQFALRYNGNDKKAIREFYGVKVVDGKVTIDLGNPYRDENYVFTFNSTLKAGDYRLEITVPQEPDNGDHIHWWNGETASDNGAVYYEFTFEFKFRVETYSISDGNAANTGITWRGLGLDVEVPYNGQLNNTAKPVIMLNRKLLVEGEDYQLLSNDKYVGPATLTVKGIHSLYGQFEILGAYTIVQGTNGWYDVPSITSWTYMGFRKDLNLISAEPSLPLDDAENGMWFAIARDSKGVDIIKGLEHILVNEKYEVTDEVAAALNKLGAGEYYLVAHVEETKNYAALNPNPIAFRVIAATNTWKVTPSVKSWTEGQFTTVTDLIEVVPMFGDEHKHVKIVDYETGEKIYFDSDAGINKLADAKHGRYLLIASVDGSDNFSELVEYRFDFEIFKKPGLPWWGVLIISIGALGAAALVILILWKKGVFQILTEKVVVSIRTRASVEATIAAVRAAKMMEEGRQSIAEAKRKERIEQLRQKAQEQRELSPEERAAQLEAKAQAEAARAEKLRERSEAIHARAEKILSMDRDGDDFEDDLPEDAEDLTDAPDIPTDDDAEDPADAPDIPTDAE